MKRSIIALFLSVLSSMGAWAAPDFEKGVMGLAESIVELWAPDPSARFKATVSVGDFEDIGPVAKELRMGDTIREALMSALSRSSAFQVVDRRNLESVLAELELQLSGMVDPATVAQAGLMAGAEAIIYGSVTEDAQSFIVNCRLVRVENGAVESASVAFDKAVFMAAAEERLDRLYVQPLGIGIAIYGMGMTLSGSDPTIVPYPDLDLTFLRTNAGIEFRYRPSKLLMLGLGGEWLYGQVWHGASVGWDMSAVGWDPAAPGISGFGPFTVVANGVAIPLSLYLGWNPVRWLSVIARAQAAYALLSFEGYFDPSVGKGFGINEAGPRLQAELFTAQFQAGAEFFISPRLALWLLAGYRLGSTELDVSGIAHLTANLPDSLDVDLSGVSLILGLSAYF